MGLPSITGYLSPKTLTGDIEIAMSTPQPMLWPGQRICSPDEEERKDSRIDGSLQHGGLPCVQKEIYLTFSFQNAVTDEELGNFHCQPLFTGTVPRFPE